jgi:hypothetical protein
MKTENFVAKHAFMSSGLTEMVVGNRYQYKEGSIIYHFIFLGWDEDEKYYVWHIKWDDGDLTGIDAEISSVKDMTGLFYSGMPHFMPENTYMTKYNREHFQKRFDEYQKQHSENSQKS